MREKRGSALFGRSLLPTVVALAVCAGCGGGSSTPDAGPGSAPEPAPAECAAGEYDSTFDAIQR